MKLKLEALVNSEAALRKLMDTKLKVGPSFWLARQARVIQAELALWNEKRGELVRAHGTADERGAAIDPAHPGWPEFVRELNELAAQEVEIGLETRPASVLGEVEIEPAVLADLHFLFSGE